MSWFYSRGGHRGKAADTATFRPRNTLEEAAAVLEEARFVVPQDGAKADGGEGAVDLGIRENP